MINASRFLQSLMLSTLRVASEHNSDALLCMMCSLTVQNHPQKQSNTTEKYTVVMKILLPIHMTEERDIDAVLLLSHVYR